MTNEWACLGLLLLLCLPQSTAKWLCSWVETPGAKCRNVLFPVHQGPLRVLSGPTHLDQSHSGEGMHLGLWWRVQNKHPRTPHQASCSECRRVMQLLQESCLGEKNERKETLFLGLFASFPFPSADGRSAPLPAHQSVWDRGVLLHLDTWLTPAASPALNGCHSKLIMWR